MLEYTREYKKYRNIYTSRNKFNYYALLQIKLQICMMSSNTTLALATMGTEKIYIDSSSGEVFVQYTGPAEM